MVTDERASIISLLAGTVVEARSALSDAIQAVARTGCFIVFDGAGGACLMTPLAQIPPRARPVSLRDARARFSELCRDCRRKPVVVTFGNHGPHAQLAAFPGPVDTTPAFGPGLNLIVAEAGMGKSVLAMRGLVSEIERDQDRDVVVMTPLGNDDLSPLLDRRRPQSIQAIALPEVASEPAGRFLIRTDYRRTFIAHGNFLRARTHQHIQAGMAHALAGVLEGVKRMTRPLVVVEYAALNCMHADPRPVSDLVIRLAEQAQVVLVENEIPDTTPWRPLAAAAQTVFVRSAPLHTWTFQGAGTGNGSVPPGIGDVLPPYTFLRFDRTGACALIPGLRLTETAAPPARHWLSRVLGRSAHS